MAVFFCHHGFILTKIISWSLDASRTAEVTKPSMIGAIRKRQPEAGLMIYTDRGVEYRAKFSAECGVKFDLNMIQERVPNNHSLSVIDSDRMIVLELR
jgi:transposase InsO family protein